MTKTTKYWACYQVHTPAGIIKNLTLEEAKTYQSLYGYFYTKMG